MSKAKSKSVSAALGVKPVTLTAVEQTVHEIPRDLPETRGNLSRFIDNRSDEVKATEDCRSFWTKLSSTDKDFCTLLESMVAIRRMYVVAYRELRNILADRPDAPAVFGDFCTQYAAYAAAMPFTEHALMQSVIGPLLNNLADIIDRHTEIEEKLEKQAKIEKTERALPFGLVHTSAQEQDTQPRKTSLVLVGMSGPVLWLLDKIVKNVAAADASTRIVRFMTSVPSKDVQSASLLSLGGSAWQACTNSDRLFDTMVRDYIVDRVSGDIDLVVCDDLAKANTTGFIGRSPAACAGDAHKRFRTWANKLGAGFLGAVIAEEATPSVESPAYEQLRTFTQLRQVSVSTEGDNYRITVGTNPQSYVVPKQEVDAFKRSALIV